jgi:hypothetical protein
VITKLHDRVGICNHKYDVSPKLHDTKFNYHLIIFILKSFWFFFKFLKFIWNILKIVCFCFFLNLFVSCYSCYLIGCSNWCDNRLKMVQFLKSLLLGTNQIPGFTSDFKMDIIKPWIKTISVKWSISLHIKLANRISWKKILLTNHIAYSILWCCDIFAMWVANLRNENGQFIKPQICPFFLRRYFQFFGRKWKQKYIVNV